MKKWLRQLKRRAVLAVFRYYFNSFVYSFDDIDTARRAMVEPSQMRYYEDVAAWVGSTAYKMEMDNLVRTAYRELSTIPTTEELFTAYRLLLVFLRNYESRLKGIAVEYNSLQLSRKQSASLK